MKDKYDYLELVISCIVELDVNDAASNKLTPWWLSMLMSVAKEAQANQWNKGDIIKYLDEHV